MTRSRWKDFFLSWAFLGLAAQPATAGDVDTHFYLTYAACRHTGINHETSLHLAAGAAWMDETFITSPMTVAGKRRLFHFPTDRNPTNLKGGFETFTVAERNHPVASIMLAEGLRERDPLKAGGGFHILEDSFTHEGYSAEAGHAYTGHWPDRPWVDPDKYDEMVEHVFKATVAVRDHLPEEALNRSATSGASAEDLAKTFLADERVQTVIRNDALTDPRYTRLAVDRILKQASEQKKILAPGVTVRSLLKEEYFNQRLSARDIIARAIADGLSKEDTTGARIFNRENLRDMVRLGRPVEIGPTPAASSFSLHLRDPLVVEKLSANLVTHQVPQALSDRRFFAYEPENVIRKKEMKIRVGDWQALIQDMFGNKVHFRHDKLPEMLRNAYRNLKTRPWSEKLSSGLFSPPEFVAAAKGERVTLSLADQVRWEMKMARFWLIDDLIRRKHFNASDEVLLYQAREALTPQEFEAWMASARSNPLVTKEDLKRIADFQARINPWLQKREKCAALSSFFSKWFEK